MTLDTLFNKRERRAFWWAALLYLGEFSDQPLDKLEQEFEELGVWDPSDNEKAAFQNELRGFSRAFSTWGDSSGRVFSKIYEKLEGLRTFASE